MLRYIFKRIFTLASFCFFLFILNLSSCGLETLYYLEPPKVSHDVPFGNEDRELAYFKFYTGENASVSDFEFIGTYVYYRIFNSRSDAEVTISSISANNSSSEISAAANYIRNSAKYHTLLDETGKEVCIEDNNILVEIRLNSYNENEDEALILKNNTRIGIPKRNLTGAKKLGFDFSKDIDTLNNPVPAKGDADVVFNDTEIGSGEWYVDVWAFNVGRDSSYTYSYSKAVHLGCVLIKEEYYSH